MVASGRALHWPGLLTVFHLIFITSIVNAVPVTYFPINSQLPPVARVSEPFSFTFSELTFASELPMTYSLGNAPKWLSIDSETRKLSGTPSDSDAPSEEIVGVDIQLVAHDDTGSATMNATLVVSRNSGPEVEIPLSEQIEGIGAYSAPSSLLLYPSRPFSFSFAEQTFRTPEEEGKDSDARLNYYAVSANSAPLPSWVAFDAENLTFAGITPPFESLVQPPQTFGFQLVASDVLGFASTSIPFSIVVGNHELTADEAVVQLNASRGKPFEYTGLLEMLNIDGRPLKMEEVTNITAVDLPRWLNFDAATWGLSGTPDAAAEPSNVTIALMDMYTDALNVTIIIEMEMELFVSDIPDMNVTAGSDWSFDLRRYLFVPQKVDISIETQPNSPWIQMDTVSERLSGTAPKPDNETYTAEITVTFKATLKRGTTTQTRTMTLHVVDPSETSPASPTIPEEVKDTSNRKLLWLLLPFLLLLCIGMVLFVLWKRRRNRRSDKIDVMEVSAPIPGTFVIHGGSNGSSLQDMRKMLDIGPPGTDTIRVVGANGEASNGTAPSSNLREAQGVPGTNAMPNLQPHALSVYKDRRKSRSDGAIPTLRDSRFTRPPRAIGHGKETMDETSLLSDTSLGEGEIQVTEEAGPSGLARTTNEDRNGTKRWMLDVPMVSEPFSIQPTPEMAYQLPPPSPSKSGKYDISSNDSSSSSNRPSYSSPSRHGSRSSSRRSSEALSPVVGYTRRAGSHRRSRPRSGLGLGLGLGLGHRLSRALKRVSGGGENNNKRTSASTGRTTRTSILTTALAEQRHPYTLTAGPSAVARPTIVHISSSSRLDEARRVSRRVGGSRGVDSPPPLFFSGGRSSPRNLTVRSGASSPLSRGSSSPDNETMSMWNASPEISVAGGVEPLKLTPEEAKSGKGKGKGRETDTTETTPPTRSAAPFQTPPMAMPRHRRQAPISQTTPSPPPRVRLPSPPPPREPSFYDSSQDTGTTATTARPLPPEPETPTPAGRGGRRPLSDRLNEATPTGTPRKEKGGHDGGYGYEYERGGENNKGDGAEDNDDSMWEDIRPPEPAFGGDGREEGSEGGSFAVYI